MLNDEGEEVIYIEYINGLPHSVTTAPIGEHGLTHFDFEIVEGCKWDLRFFRSGMGGRRDELQAPHFVDGHGTSYWMADDCKFRGKTKAINCVRIDKPIQLQGIMNRSINPFKVSQETVNHFEYCSFCDYYTCSGDGCSEHQEYSEKKESLIYIHDGSLVE